MKSDSRSLLRRPFVAKAALYGLMSLLAIPFAYPTIWMVFAAFKPSSEIFSHPPTLFPRQWTLDGVSKIFTAQPFAQQYFNSVYIAIVVTLATIILTALAGYSFARIKFPFRQGIFVLLVSTMFLPAEVTIIPIFRWVNEWGLMDTHWPLIIPPILGPWAVMPIFIFRQFYLSFPTELEEAACLDGLGRMATFWRVVFPLSGPAIGAVGIVTFLRSFNMYFEPLIFLRSPELFTVSIGLTRYMDNYAEPLYNTQLGATSLAVIPILIVFLFAQRQFVEGLTRTGLKG